MAFERILSRLRSAGGATQHGSKWSHDIGCVPADMTIWTCPRCTSNLPSLEACGRCHTRWSTRSGIPWLVNGEEVRTRDRVMGALYSSAPRLHDVALRTLLPFLGGMSEKSSREEIFKRLRLDELSEGPHRFLDVGCGTGGNLVRLGPRLVPRGFSIVGVDIAEGMLVRARQRLQKKGLSKIFLAGADVHRLPFADQSFDRVLHVGAVNSFGDPALAIREICRVAKPGARVVLVDEQAAPEAENASFAWKLLFNAVTFYSSAPKSPVSLLENVSDVRDEQLDRAFYCLSFKIGGQREGI